MKADPKLNAWYWPMMEQLHADIEKTKHQIAKADWNVWGPSRRKFIASYERSLVSLEVKQREILRANAETLSIVCRIVHGLEAGNLTQGTPGSFFSPPTRPPEYERVIATEYGGRRAFTQALRAAVRADLMLERRTYQ